MSLSNCTWQLDAPEWAVQPEGQECAQTQAALPSGPLSISGGQANAVVNYVMNHQRILYSKGWTLPKEKFGPVPLAPGREPLSLEMSCLFTGTVGHTRPFM